MSSGMLKPSIIQKRNHKKRGIAQERQSLFFMSIMNVSNVLILADVPQNKLEPVPAANFHLTYALQENLLIPPDFDK